MENKLFFESSSIFQVILTKLTQVNKTRLLLRLTNFDKKRLVAFRSFDNKESDFMLEKCRRVWMTLIHFLLLLPTDSCFCQLTVVVAKFTVVVAN